ncbi:MAG: Maf family protein [Proteobacteria bacterium]|nr:Maf family protein [Pseudomonadota bacterium]
MITGLEGRPLVLASNSRAREIMLRQAGLKITVQPADLDEGAIKAALQTASSAAGAIAAALAQAKAQAVARYHPDAWVIGADQILSCDGELFDKAPDVAAAGTILRRLQGRRHELHAAVCVVRYDGTEDLILWHHTCTAQLWMRSLSDDLIAGYLDQAGRSVLCSVGCYRIEGLGVQLFDRIEGDHFTILGLPLMPLLHFLRTAGLSRR